MASSCLQESIPPETSQGDVMDQQSRLNARYTDSTECLSPSDIKEKIPVEKSLDLSSSVADCCCIGPRSKLPLPRLPLSPCARVSKGCDTFGMGNAASTGADVTKIGGNEGEEERQSIQPPTRFESTRLPPNSNANNNCGGLQMGSHGSQPQSSTASSSTNTTNSTTITTTANAGLAPSSFTPIAHNTVSVPRQIAQWTKHHTLKLQVIIKFYHFSFFVKLVS